MKKLLTILSSISLIAQPITLTIACEPIESFPSVSSNISIDELNDKLFKHNNIRQIYFENLEYVGKYFEHLNFDSGLVSIKASEPVINLNPDYINEKDFLFYKDLENIFEPIALGNNSYDYTGLTFFIENIFIDDFTISKNENKLESHVETTMAVSVLKGWKMKGKMLLTVTQNQNSNGVIPYLFINTWLKSFYDNFIPTLNSESEFILNDEFDTNLESLKSTILNKQSDLKGLSLTSEDITIFEDNSGFSILNQKYIYELEETE